MSTPIRTDQQWLPGLEPQGGDTSAAARLKRPGGRGAPKPPPIEKLLSKVAPRSRKTFGRLRDALNAEQGLAERVQYDDLAQDFTPAYAIGTREVLRLDLDPVLAATLTLDPGDRQLARILESPRLDDPLKAQVLKSARRSGRRIFLAFVVRNAADCDNLLKLVRERLALDTVRADSA